jgi:hypothetical protein
MVRSRLAGPAPLYGAKKRTQITYNQILRETLSSATLGVRATTWPLP